MGECAKEKAETKKQLESQVQQLNHEKKADDQNTSAAAAQAKKLVADAKAKATKLVVQGEQKAKSKAAELLSEGEEKAKGEKAAKDAVASGASAAPAAKEAGAKKA